VGGHSDSGGTDGLTGLLFARDVPVRGRLSRAGALLVATLDRRPAFNPWGHAELAGIGAFDAATGEARWSAWGLPALAAATPDAVYAYSRAGVVVALAPDGRERWRATVPDDRSAQGRARGDRDATLLADVLPLGGAVALAASAEVLLLSAADGAVLARAAPCTGERAVVSRLGRAADGALIATCTARAEGNDEEAQRRRELWQAPPPPESLRTAPGQLVAFEPDLRPRWHLAPPLPDLVYGDLAPVADGGTVALAAARSMSDGPRRYVSLAHARLLAVDGQTGAVRWHRDMPGGRGAFDPARIGEGVVAGYAPVCYRLADGAVRWRVPASRPQLDPHTAPVVDGDRLLFTGEGAVIAVDARDGARRVLARLTAQPSGAAVTTTLLLNGGVLYAGVRESERPTQLRAVRLPPG
jgi:outer membrane protein assembly factor BamB